MPLDGEFAKLYQEMDRSFVKPLWTSESAILAAQPHSKAVPWLWKWRQIYGLAKRSGELITIERGGDRRAMALSNPGLGGSPLRDTHSLGRHPVAERGRSGSRAPTFVASSAVHHRRAWRLQHRAGRQGLSRARRFRDQSSVVLARSRQRGRRAAPCGWMASIFR